MLCQMGLECLGVFPAMSDRVVERLTPVIVDRTLPLEFRRHAVRVVANYGPLARGAMPALVRFMQEDDPTQLGVSPQYRSPATIEAIGRIGPISREAILVLMKTLEEEKAKSPPQSGAQRRPGSPAQPVQHLSPFSGYSTGSTGGTSPNPPARPKSVVALEIVLQNLPKESIPELMEIIADTEVDASLRQLAIAALQEAESNAKSAVPALEKFFETEQPADLYEAATKALDIIDR